MALKISQIEMALRRNGGVLAGAARSLKVTRQAIQNRVKKSAKLQMVLEEVIETNLDLAESKLLQALGSGNMTAIIFYLKTKGKHRGYVERQEQTGPEGGPIQTEDVTLDDDERSRRIAALLDKGRARRDGSAASGDTGF